MSITDIIASPNPKIPGPNNIPGLPGSILDIMDSKKKEVVHHHHYTTSTTTTTKIDYKVNNVNIGEFHGDIHIG